MNITHVVASLENSTGGPARSVVSLADALSLERGIRVTLASQRVSGSGVEQASPDSAVQRMAISPGNKLIATLFGANPFPPPPIGHQGLPHIIHDHGIWLPINHWASVVAHKYDIPKVVHTRGMLEPWALRFRNLKKRVALALYQRRDLMSAKLFFATAEQEAEGLRRFGINQPIAVIPNGVAVPDGRQAGNAAPSMLGKSQRAARKALFLGRIHPVKGILNLLEAWARVHPSGWKLVLAGPDEAGHLPQVQRRINQLGLNSSVELAGCVEGDRKDDLYASADLFVLPSFSENFGLVVAEALGHGVPVITTRGTPWAGLEERRCGWWVEPTARGVEQALREATSLDTVQLREMGDRGRRYARQFEWQKIAKDTLAVYWWVLGQSDRPACVLLD